MNNIHSPYEFLKSRRPNKFSDSFVIRKARDSKVDSETYPVSDNIALTWYSGIGREAACERWAFAISAKQEWQS